MKIKKPTSSRILAAIQAAGRQLGTNPYQIVKATGIPLTTVQRLMRVSSTKPLRNVEMLMAALGLRCQLVPSGTPMAQPGTGRRHGKRRRRT